MKKYAIFGAGKTGRQALIKYGADRVTLFVDNDTDKKGLLIQKIPVENFCDAIDKLKEMHVVIACKAWGTIEKQLRDNNITDYEVYNKRGYYDFPELVVNPYLDGESGSNEWIRDEINNQVKSIDSGYMFDHVEIETINRCNGACSFCPVNRNIDTRELKIMDLNLFNKIIDELREINYCGRLALFSNNEPLLDDRIIELHKIARHKLPQARMHLCTNGTLLKLDIFIELMQYLDELIIDNYNHQLELIPNSKKIVEYCENHQELKNRVTIILRNPDEVLTNRGGDAPNSEKTSAEANVSCLLPYKQLIVRPDGKVSLCCNDALGRCTMGDLSKNTLKEVWFGEPFRKVRELIKSGRSNYERCKFCDTIFLC